MPNINNYGNVYKSYTSKGFSGLASGMDTESLVKSMLSGTQNKINKQKQIKQQLEWKQESYRDIILKFQNFQSNSMNYLKADSNIMSESFFNKVNINSSSKSVELVNSNNFFGNIKIEKIDQLATASVLSGAEGISSKAIELNISEEYFQEGMTIDVNLDGITKKITLSNKMANGDVGDFSTIQDNFKKSLTNAFGSGITFEMDGSKMSLSVSKDRQLTISSNEESTKQLLNFQGSISSKITMNDKIGKELSFKINNQEFNFNEDDTYGTIINKVNSSGSGVIMKYNSIRDSFSLEAKNTGEGIQINVSSDDTLSLQSLFGDVSERKFVEGQNAMLRVNGVDISRNSNTFEVDGATLKLKSTSTADNPIEISSSRDTSKILDGIKSFIQSYNDIISHISSKLKEERDYNDYPPLTDEQKEEMSEKEIESWEKKAKTGLLNNDSLLNSVTSMLRDSLYEQTNGVSLYELGITTTKEGILSIDEEKLKQKIETEPDVVSKFFAGKDGFASKMNKTIDNIAKTSTANPGVLVQKAGLKNTSTVNRNIISEQMKSIDDAIKRLNSTYNMEKNRYWKMFSQMESVINKTNSQSAWLSNMFM